MFRWDRKDFRANLKKYNIYFPIDLFTYIILFFTVKKLGSNEMRKEVVILLF